MDHLYRAYDWTLASDLPLPGLAELPADDRPPDLRAFLGSFPPWTDTLFEEPGEVWAPMRTLPEELWTGLRVTTHREGAWFRFRYDTGAEFLVDQGGTEIWARWCPPFTSDDAALYVVGPILGFILRLRGRTCLHASAVVVDGRALALIGPSGAGKSTTAAALTQRGHPLLADDVLVLAERSGGYAALPGHPRQKLLPDAVEHLEGSPTAHALLTPHWDKLAVEYESTGDRYCDREAPLLVAYLLRGGDEDVSAPRRKRERPSHIVPVLAANTYRSELLDARMRAEEFRFLAGLVSRVPVCTLSYPRGLQELGRLVDAILADARDWARASRPPSCETP